MTFNSILYGLFLLSIFIVYWCLQEQKLRLWTLFIASLVFYASLQIQYIPLLLASVLINFYLGLRLGENTGSGRHRKNWKLTNAEWQFAQQDWNWRRLIVLIFAISLNILLLLSFKYLPFIFTSLSTYLSWPYGLEIAEWFSKHAIAPVGISFFTFECIAYLVDIYRGAPAATKLSKFAAYKFFFPKLLSGPITRYHYLANQFKTLEFPRTNQLVEGLWLIASGAVKKSIIADNLGIFVDLCFGNLQRAGSGDLWLATCAYGLQLYLDFSGYVDLARGSALLLGLHLPPNFDFPYFSTSIAEFWRRWHITLGDWLRNYIYFPLGGSRAGLIRTCFNLLIVMVIAGIWHGAAWGFIFWGFLHGLGLVIHRLTESICNYWSWLKSGWQSLPGIVIAWLLTQGMVFGSWIFFRLPNFKDSGWVWEHFWGHQADIQFAQKVYLEALGLSRFQVISLILALVTCMSINYAVTRGLKVELTLPLKALLVPLSLYAVFLLAPAGGLPYIYFDF